MELKSFVLILSVFVLIHKSCAQNRFLVNVVEMDAVTLANPSMRCIGTVLSSRHILTTATCLLAVPRNRILGIEAQFAVTNSSIHFINRTTRHPDFMNSNRNVEALTSPRNDIAILEIDNPLNTTIFRPQSIGALETERSCSLFALNTAAANPGAIVVAINRPSTCVYDNNQVFCSIILSVEQCLQVRPGSPVTCGQSGFIGGIVVNNCSHQNLIIQYHNVGQFRNWIEGVVSGDMRSEDNFDY
ncbi:CLUMA_CG016402, isoform A [Clunio marinus]|uniref:CLUMA_CG016402, isoform A n=1 Tax=Clunio marinus TaxID=568069 RepID=A0A1J1IYZ7_9DIPT|nr:CLUMA_CG016402, isoform A [Clunio marinus]